MQQEGKMGKVFYKVKVIQEIPYVSYDDMEEELEPTGQTEEYIAGTFATKRDAELFKDALETKIAEECGYALNCYTPRVMLIRVTRTEEIIEQ
jgi:hypothetical protein